MSATVEQTTAFRELFLHQGTQYTYRKGEFIIRPGEFPPGIFFIESGLVKAYDITKYGEENMLIIRRQDEVFPLIWAMTGQDRDVIYEAMVPTCVRLLRREIFQDFLDVNPGSLALMLDMAIEMYRVHSERIISLSYRNVRERLVSFLVSAVSRFGVDTTPGSAEHILLNVPLRHQDIGSSINASRETVGREIQALERKGLVKSADGYITLLDLPALQKLL
jgi:CRP/FNR family cyclic AMP-dependent transcriptional regulator